MAAKNPLRYYPLHHYVLLPMAGLLVFYSIYGYLGISDGDSDVSRLWLFQVVSSITFIGVLLMLRQHYALMLQDRIARLEVRQRYFEVSGKRFAELEKDLSIKQILTLRLAGDAELPALALAAAKEKLSSAAIMARINDYQFDTMRV